MLLASGDQRLLEPAADGFARMEPQGRSGHREDPLRVRRAEPLELFGQLVAGESAMDGLIRRSAACRIRCRHLDIGNQATLGQPQPAVIAPNAFLDRRFAPERRPADPGQWARAEMGVVDLAVRGLDHLAVARALEHCIRRILRGHQEGIGMQFIRPGQVARPRHGDGMVIAGAALRHSEIVPAIAPEQVRAFDQAVIAAGEDVDRLTDQLALPASYSWARMPANAGCFGLPPTESVRWFQTMLRNHLRPSSS
jgi:hypothetical protein